METPDNKYGNYRWGLFYYNRNDTKIFAPKNPRRGLLFNFANIWSYVLLVVIIAALACIYKLVLQYAASITGQKNHYVAGVIYYNKADGRLFIPRTNGSGWDLNFSNYWSYLFLGLIILIIIYSILRSFEQKKSKI